MPMYHVIILPMAEDDIVSNTDYIAFEKRAPETALRLAVGLRNTIAKLDKNHKIFYYIDTEKVTVYVLRVLHMLVNAKPLLLKMNF